MCGICRKTQSFILCVLGCVFLLSIAFYCQLNYKLVKTDGHGQSYSGNIQQNENDFQIPVSAIYLEERSDSDDDLKWIQEMSDIYERASLDNSHINSFVKQNNSNEKCNDFHSSFKENLHHVLNYPINISTKYLTALNLDRSKIKNTTSKTVKSNYPTLASGSSSNHYRELQGLIRDYHKNMLPLYPNMKLIVYDLGLKSNQLNQLKKYCRCDVRQFPFDSFPKHIRNLSSCGWKPLIIQLLMREFDFVMWTDTSIRFNGNPLDKLFLEAKLVGIQVMSNKGSIAVRTNERTFVALGEKRCLFDYPEVGAGFVIITRSKFTMNAIMKPWVSCTLQYGCLDFDNSKSYIACPTGKKQKFGSCHRFDQSVIGIILRRLFNYKSYLCQFDIKKIGSVNRGDNVNYFPK